MLYTFELQFLNPFDVTFYDDNFHKPLFRPGNPKRADQEPKACCSCCSTKYPSKGTCSEDSEGALKLFGCNQLLARVSHAVYNLLIKHLLQLILIIPQS